MVSKCKAWCTCKFTKHDYPIIHYSYLFPFNFSVKFCPCVCFLFPRIFILLAINQQRSLFQVTMSITTSSRLFPLASMATSASIQLLTSTRSHSWWVVNTLFRAFRKFTHIFAEFTQLLHDFNLFVQKLGGVFYKWVWGHFIGDAYSMSIYISSTSRIAEEATEGGWAFARSHPLRVRIHGQRHRGSRGFQVSLFENWQSHQKAR